MFTLLYLRLLVYLQLWFWIKMPKSKREEAGSPSKSERQKLQRLCKQSGAVYGSVRNLVKTSNLPVSKVRHFLHWKLFYTKFFSTKRKFKRMQAFARFKIEIGCMDLACVAKLAEDNKGVKYLLVRQDLFDRTVDEEGMKTKDSKKTVRAFFIMITQQNRPREIWVHKRTEFAGEFKTLWKAEGIQTYSTMSETKSAFAERTMRSLKSILHRHIKEYR